MDGDDTLLRPLPRRRLGPWTRLLLMGLRLYVLAALALVALAFIRAFHG